MEKSIFFKKLTALLLALTMCMALFGCGDDSDGGKKKSKKNETNDVAGATEKDSGKVENSVLGGSNSVKKGESLELGTLNVADDYAEFELMSIKTTPAIDSTIPSGAVYQNYTEGEIYIDAKFRMKNISDGVIDCRDFMKMSATDNNGKKYVGNFFAVESKPSCCVGPYDNIDPSKTVTFHAATSVPVNSKEFSLEFEVLGNKYSYNYKLNDVVEKLVPLNVGDEIQNTDYASMKFVGVSFADILTTSKGVEDRFFDLSESDDTYMVISFDITNYDENERTIEELIGLRPVFNGKYAYEPSILCEYSDSTEIGAASRIKPLETQKIMFVSEIPEAAAELDYEATVVFDYNDYIIKK